MSMDSPPYAFVTLVTTDHYLLGALVLAAALRDLHPSPPKSPQELDPCKFHIVCLVTPATVNVQTLKLLRRTFDVVIGVETIQEDTEEALKLLGRPDLGTVLTKIHIFRLDTYRKIIYLDADVLPLLPLSHLFHTTSSFAAVPDVGWPDIFNSGVIVLAPGEDKFREIIKLIRSDGSWDGGDQGVLNEWRGNDWQRLSFTYNTTPTAAYTYAPAYMRFGSEIKAIHFIGLNKPWLQLPFRASGSSSQLIAATADDSFPPSNAHHPYSYPALLDRWFAVYDKHYCSITPIFTATGELIPSAAFVETTYENAWNSNVRSSAVSSPTGLDRLRQLALEGHGQTPTKEDGEGAYMTLPLDGRIHLISPAQSHLRKLSPLKIKNSVPDATSQPPVFLHSSGVAPLADVLPQTLAALSLLNHPDSHDLTAKSPSNHGAASSQWDPWSIRYSNAWDLIPGIQKYASQHRAGSTVEGQRANEASIPPKMEPVYRPWEEGTSGDGDDEAEAEDLEGGREL